MPAQPVALAAATLQALLTDRDSGRLDAALRTALDSADEAALKGELARRAGNVDAATRLLDAALAHRDDVRALHHACALAHAAAGESDAARTRWTALLERFPDDPVARFQIGVSYHDDGRLHEAVQWYEAQLARVPSMAPAWLNLGHVHRSLGDATLAIAAWRRAHDANREDVKPLLLAARLCGERADLPEAVELATRVIDVAPGSAEARYLRAAHRSSLALHADAVDDLVAALALDPQNAAGRSALLLELHYDESHRAPRAMRAEHEAWAARHAAPPRAERRSRNGAPEERVRVGYVSPRFGDAPLHALLLPVLEAHDRRRFEIFAYDTHGGSGDATQRVRAIVDTFRTLPASDDDAARIVEADAIDVLVDLCGHAPGNRLPLLSRGLATRQATWLDYFDTTGVPAIDYLIGDGVHTPPSHAARFVERLVLMPHARFTYRPPAEFARPATHRHADAPMFGSFNRHAKIGDDVIDTWAAILDAVPGSRLALRAAAYRSPSTVAWIRERWRTRGVDVDRITFAAYGTLPELHDAYASVDIALDPFPFNGGVTTCDALAHGIPVVTLEGDRMISRQGSALLRAAGRSRWIARDREEYVARAVALAQRGTLEDERAGLAAGFSSSPLCDVAGFTRALERSYNMMLDAAASRTPMTIDDDRASSPR